MAGRFLIEARGPSHDQSEAFYRNHGFLSFGSQPKQLVLPLTNLVIKQ